MRKASLVVALAASVCGADAAFALMPRLEHPLPHPGNVVLVRGGGGGGGGGAHSPHVSTGGEHGGFAFTPSQSINQASPSNNWTAPGDPSGEARRAKRRHHRPGSATRHY